MSTLTGPSRKKLKTDHPSFPQPLSPHQNSQQQIVKISKLLGTEGRGIDFHQKLEILRNFMSKAIAVLTLEYESKSDFELYKEGIRNVQVVMGTLKEGRIRFPEYEEEFRNNRAFVLMAVKQLGIEYPILDEVNKEFCRDKEVVLTAVKQYRDNLQYASEELRGDREVVIAAAQGDWWTDTNMLQYTTEKIRKDKEVILAAVKQDAYALKYASEELRNDREVVLAALEIADGGDVHDSPLQFASKELQENKVIILKFIQAGYSITPKFITQKLKGDKEVILEAVKQDGRALEYAGKGLRNDREVVLAAVKQDGRALEYANKELRNDREVVLAAVKQDRRALMHASKELVDKFLGMLKV